MEKLFKFVVFICFVNMRLLFHNSMKDCKRKKEKEQKWGTVALVLNQGRVVTNVEMAYFKTGRKEENVLFNDALNTFYLRLYGVEHMVMDSERGNPLPLLFPISSKGSFIFNRQDSTHQGLWYTSRGALATLRLVSYKFYTASFLTPERLNCLSK